MIEKLRNWLPLLPLLLLLAGTYWLDQQVRPLPVVQDNSKLHDPDFIVSDFQATALDEQGRPHHRINAHTLTHYPDDDSLYLERPDILALAPDRPTLRITAQTGTTYQRDETIMRGDVRIVRAASQTASERVLTTTYLRALPSQDYAETDRPVTMNDAYNLVNAVGMTLDNKTRIIRLLSQVRSEHVPTN